VATVAHVSDVAPDAPSAICAPMRQFAECAPARMRSGLLVVIVPFCRTNWLPTMPPDEISRRCPPKSTSNDPTPFPAATSELILRSELSDCADGSAMRTLSIESEASINAGRPAVEKVCTPAEEYVTKSSMRGSSAHPPRIPFCITGGVLKRSDGSALVTVVVRLNVATPPTERCKEPNCSVTG
jgi:hypothetical protein